jgi:threonine dehydratase
VTQTTRKPNVSGVHDALKKLRKVTPQTPIRRAQIGESTVWLKCESAQPMGAFKLRGAWHRLTALSAAEQKAGVVAFSSGNHAQGVAWAAQKLKIAATIVMPSDAPALKIAGTRTLGAEVILYDRATQSREAIAAELAQARGAVLVPSFDDPWIIEGQGSCGLEAAEQLGFAPTRVIVPCGGGGLAAGISLALPNAAIVTVEPEGWDDMAQSLRAGHIIPVGKDAPPTLCDALMTPRVSPLTFDVLHGGGAHGVAASEAETAAAMRFAYHELGLTIEPGGAVALAAVISGKLAHTETTLIILSGGNVDPALFAQVISG